MRKRGQVWVETVIYTLIALALIGLILTFVKPKISELQDKVIIQQSISMLNDINNVVLSLAESGPGNKRKVDLNLKSGSLTIDGAHNKIVFSMDSNYQFSEPGRDVNYGDLIIRTETFNDISLVNATLNYSSYNITYKESETPKTITKSSTPYSLFITNKGGSSPNMDFSVG